GNCSMPRVASSASNDGLQSKWASMWFMQQAQTAHSHERTEEALPYIQKLPPRVSFSAQTEHPVLRELPPYSESPRETHERRETISDSPSPRPRITEAAVDERPRSANRSELFARIRQALPLHLKISRRAIGLTAVSLILI